MERRRAAGPSNSSGNGGSSGNSNSREEEGDEDAVDRGPVTASLSSSRLLHLEVEDSGAGPGLLATSSSSARLSALEHSRQYGGVPEQSSRAGSALLSGSSSDSDSGRKRKGRWHRRRLQSVLAIAAVVVVVCVALSTALRWTHCDTALWRHQVVQSQRWLALPTTSRCCAAARHLALRGGDRGFPAPPATQPTLFKVVVATYNARAVILDRCIRSIIRAINGYHRSHVSVMIVDDAGTIEVEETRRLAARYQESGMDIRYFRTRSNHGPVLSRVLGMRLLNCTASDVVVLIDGDDALIDAHVFSYLDTVYRKTGALLTFGTMRVVRGDIITGDGGVHPVKPVALWTTALTGTWRQAPWMFSHLKTFRYQLWQQVDVRASLTRDGEFLREATDQAMMYPLLQLAGMRVVHTPRIMYLYTADHPENMHADAARLAKQREAEAYVQNLRIPYVPVDQPVCDGIH